MIPHAGRMLSYNPRTWPWRDHVERVLALTDLERLHTLAPRARLFTREQDQSTPWHAQFYDGWPGLLAQEYERFVRAVVRPLYNGPIVYQKVPTFRVHMPGNVSVGEWHRDSDYAHGAHEENFWLPITAAPAGRTLAVEFVQGSGYYHDVPMAYGQLLWFDGANLLHGCHINSTQLSRLSFDFRVVPEALHQDRDDQTVNAKMPMRLGYYFERME